MNENIGEGSGSNYSNPNPNPNINPTPGSGPPQGPDSIYDHPGYDIGNPDNIEPDVNIVYDEPFHYASNRGDASNRGGNSVIDNYNYPPSNYIVYTCYNNQE